jgi:hypothetical protein
MPFNYSIPQFVFSNPAAMVSLETRIYPSDFDSFPACIKAIPETFQLEISAQICPSTTFAIRVEGLVFNSTYGIYTHSNFTYFRIQISSKMNCYGFDRLELTQTPYLFRSYYLDTSNPDLIEDN